MFHDMDKGGAKVSALPTSTLMRGRMAEEGKQKRALGRFTLQREKETRQEGKTSINLDVETELPEGLRSGKKKGAVREGK